jgi:cytochrome c-type biogenesis protein CcmH/NrfG
MHPLRALIVSGAFLPSLLLLPPGAGAAEQTSDPNAGVRKADPGQRALAELERVQKMNQEAAVVQYSSRIKQDPGDTEAYVKRGKAYSGLRNYPAARKDYDEAIRLDPKRADAYAGRALLRFLEKDYDGSWKDVHKAQSLGGEVRPPFLEALKKMSGRDK